MHPALSVIVFTVASGAGYGLLAVLALIGLRAAPLTGAVLAIGVVVALSLAAFGLGVSALHLGRPERAWRAFSQWRSSWLSREGIAATATFAPAAAFAWSLVANGGAPGWWLLAPVLTMAGALATLVATGMIYASLKPIRQWRDRRVVPGYVLQGLASGALIAVLLARLLGDGIALTPAPIALATLAAAAAVKLGYWRAIDRGRAASTVGSALGLGEVTARLLDPPHTGTNYLLKEMGFRVARKHAARLRAFALGAGMLVPMACVALAWAAAPGAAATVPAALAVVANLAGTLVERWLFFAEATHTVMLYYGADAV